MIEEKIPLEPCHPGCTKRCSRNRMMVRALLVSLGLLAGPRSDGAATAGRRSSSR